MFLRADPALHSRPEREVTQVCMERAYKFRIYPTSEQETLLQKTFGCTRYVYNYYLNKRMTAYQTDKTTLNYYACSADLTHLKKEKDWLREPDKFALQSALRNLDDAYQSFFDRVQKGEAPGYPKFKSKHDRDRSYTTRFTNGNIRVLDKHVRLPKLGLVKCRISRQVEGRILSATVSQKSSGKYFVSITCTDVVQESLGSTGAIVGIDLGLKEPASHLTTSASTILSAWRAPRRNLPDSNVSYPENQRVARTAIRRESRLRVCTRRLPISAETQFIS